MEMDFLLLLNERDEENRFVSELLNLNMDYDIGIVYLMNEII